MSNHKQRVSALLMLILLGTTQLSLQAAEPWRAGSAKVVITPQQFIWMSGYGSRDHVAEGKLTELWAKALVLQDPLGNRPTDHGDGRQAGGQRDHHQEAE